MLKIRILRILTNADNFSPFEHSTYLFWVYRYDVIKRYRFNSCCYCKREETKIRLLHYIKPFHYDSDNKWAVFNICRFIFIWYYFWRLKIRIFEKLYFRRSTVEPNKKNIIKFEESRIIKYIVSFSNDNYLKYATKRLRLG